MERRKYENVVAGGNYMKNIDGFGNTLDQTPLTMKNYPRLETERLILRKPEASDIASIVQHINNPNVAEPTLNIPYPYHPDDAVFWINMARQGFLNKEKYIFALAHRAIGAVIGGVGLHIKTRFNHAELGYWISEDFWNQGLMSEAVARVIRFGFEELDLNKIYAVHQVENPASGQVMLKNGMRKEGILLQHYKKGEVYQDIVQYGILKRDWE